MKIWVIKKSTGLIYMTVFMLFIGLVCLGRTQTMMVAGADRDLPIYCVDKGEEKVVSISFDAAWGAEDTMQLIDILNQYDVKATFFVVGSWVDEFPDAVKALSEAGHEIMNHSNSHPHMTRISKEKMKAEVEKCNEKIAAITGKIPDLFRAPYGDYNNDVIQAVRECGCYPIQWSVDSLDWKDLTATQITERVMGKLHPGAIMLFHNAALHTPEALPDILKRAQNAGYQFVPISELIYRDHYTIDRAGKQLRTDA